MSKIKESNGTHNGEPNKEHIICPVENWNARFNCPYYHNGACYNDNPEKECYHYKMYFRSWWNWESGGETYRE